MDDCHSSRVVCYLSKPLDVLVIIAAEKSVCSWINLVQRTLIDLQDNGNTLV